MTIISVLIFIKTDKSENKFEIIHKINHNKHLNETIVEIIPEKFNNRDINKKTKNYNQINYSNIDNLKYFHSYLGESFENKNYYHNNNFNKFYSFSTIKSKDTINKNCNEMQNLKFLRISTNSNENSDDFNVEILKDCEIQKMWKTRDDILKSCDSPKRVIEGEDNNRRAFRFSYLKSNQISNLTESIIINRINMEYPNKIAQSSLTKTKLILNPGDIIDIYLKYDCFINDNNSRNDFNENWYKIKILLEFKSLDTLSFEFIKVCDASYIESFDTSHLIIICFIFLVVFLSTKEFLKSKFEVIVVEKYTEIRNPENLLVIGLVISLILIFIGVINIFESWITLVILIIGPVSIAMITEASLKYNEILTHLENRSYEIPFLGSISFLFSSCLLLGIIITIIYFYTENWIFNNIIAIAVALITIRLFKFTNFKLILMMFLIRIFYDIIWTLFNSQYFTENYKLSHNSSNHLPIKFVCPEFSSTPFNSCNFLPIADIILPGFLNNYLKIFDEKKGGNLYFLTSTISLGFGLILNMIVYYLYKLPLPLFLFTGPIIITTIIVIAFNKGDFNKIIEGFSSTLLENNLDKNMKKLSFQQKIKSNVEYVPPKL